MGPLRAHRRRHGLRRVHGGRTHRQAERVQVRQRHHTHRRKHARRRGVAHVRHHLRLPRRRRRRLLLARRAARRRERHPGDEDLPQRRALERAFTAQNGRREARRDRVQHRQRLDRGKGRSVRARWRFSGRRIKRVWVALARIQNRKAQPLPQRRRQKRLHRDRHRRRRSGGVRCAHRRVFVRRRGRRFFLLADHVMAGIPRHVHGRAHHPLAGPARLRRARFRARQVWDAPRLRPVHRRRSQLLARVLVVLLGSPLVRWFRRIRRVTRRAFRQGQRADHVVAPKTRPGGEPAQKARGGGFGVLYNGDGDVPAAAPLAVRPRASEPARGQRVKRVLTQARPRGHKRAGVRVRRREQGPDPREVFPKAVLPRGRVLALRPALLHAAREIVEVARAPGRGRRGRRGGRVGRAAAHVRDGRAVSVLLRDVRADDLDLRRRRAHRFIRAVARRRRRAGADLRKRRGVHRRRGRFQHPGGSAHVRGSGRGREFGRRHAHDHLHHRAGDGNNRLDAADNPFDAGHLLRESRRRQVFARHLRHAHQNQRRAVSHRARANRPRAG